MERNFTLCRQDFFGRGNGDVLYIGEDMYNLGTTHDFVHFGLDIVRKGLTLKFVSIPKYCDGLEYEIVFLFEDVDFLETGDGFLENGNVRLDYWGFDGGLLPFPDQWDPPAKSKPEDKLVFMFDQGEYIRLHAKRATATEVPVDKTAT